MKQGPSAVPGDGQEEVSAVAEGHLSDGQRGSCQGGHLSLGVHVPQQDLGIVRLGCLEGGGHDYLMHIHLAYLNTLLTFKRGVGVKMKFINRSFNS